MFVNKLISHISLAHISESKRCLNVKSSTYYFHMETTKLADFQICISVPLKANQADFMMKELNNVIMIRSRLRNKYEKGNIANSKIAYNTQKMTLRISYVRAKSINISAITDHKKFWKTVKPPFSDKISHKGTTNLVENYATLSYDQIIADTSSNYFNEIVRNLPTLIKKLP